MSDNVSRTLVHVPVGSVTLEGDLAIPGGATAIVIFAHGSGSSRHSRRNKYVAEVLVEAGIATLLFDLLTRKEDEVYETRFDIGLLTRRLKVVSEWVLKQPQSADLRTGFFGSSTGAAAALWAAADLGLTIGAVVSRGGRPDLAEEYLGHVLSPTLLIVGGRDDVVVELNRHAYKLIKAEKELKIVPGATHLFEEPGALEEVARLAADWFRRHQFNCKTFSP
jgi:dienelactone hydrolase